MAKYVTSRKLDMFMYSILSHCQWFRSKITVAGSISLNRANPVFSGVIDQTCIASLLSLLRSQGHCLCGKLVQKLLVNFTINYKETASNKCNNVTFSRTERLLFSFKTYNQIIFVILTAVLTM